MITTKISEEHLQLVKALSNESVDELNQTQIIGAAINEYANRNGYTKVANGYATLGDTIEVVGGELTIANTDNEKVFFTNGSSCLHNEGSLRRASKVND